MSIQFIEKQIALIPKCPHPPSQAAYCEGAVAMAVLACLINYRQQAQFERRIDDLKAEYWTSKGIPA